MKCPSCQHDLNHHIDQSGQVFQPEPGDLGICFYCGCRTIVIEESIIGGKRTMHKLAGLTPEIAETLSPMERVQHQRMWEAWSQQYGMKAS